MELCEGGELFDRIVKKGSFSEKEASRVIRQVLSAIQHLHVQGIVHRDLKPENLLFTTNEDNADVKLVDFGLAKQIENPDERSFLKASLSGTVAYSAPERLREDQESKAVDMWSLGCILYFLLFGIPPFYSEKETEEECEDEIVDAVMAGKVTFPQETKITPHAKDLIERLLDKDPANRITAEQALIHPWIVESSINHSSENQVTKTSPIDQTKLKKDMNKVIDTMLESHGSEEDQSEDEEDF